MVCMHGDSVETMAYIRPSLSTHSLTRDLKITYPVRLWICMKLSPSLIGRRCFSLTNHDSPEKGFSAPETKCSLVTGIKCSFQSYN